LKTLGIKVRGWKEQIQDCLKEMKIGS